MMIGGKRGMGCRWWFGRIGRLVVVEKRTLGEAEGGDEMVGSDRRWCFWNMVMGAFAECSAGSVLGARMQSMPLQMMFDLSEVLCSAGYLSFRSCCICICIRYL